MRGPSPTTALSSCNDPVQRVDVTGQVHGTEERLATQEPILTRNIQQVPDASVREVLVLDGRSQPDVTRPSTKPRRKSTSEVRPLGQQQPVEVRSTLYKSPESVTQPVEATVPLEHVPHRRAEHTRTTSESGRLPIPTKWLAPVVVAEFPARSIGTPDTVARTSRPDFGVAVIARRGDLCAPPPRVERMARPFNCRVFRHCTVRVRGGR